MISFWRSCLRFIFAFALFFRGQRANLLRVNAEAKAKGDVETPLTKLHVHFGCGRLGMGLLSPAMAEAQRPVILIDGPFGDYEKLVKEGHKTVNFYVNGEVRGLPAGSVCWSSKTEVYLILYNRIVHHARNTGSFQVSRLGAI